MNKIIEKSKRAPIRAILMALMATGAILEPKVAVADPWAEKQDLPSLRRSVESDMAYAAILELGRRKDTASVPRLQKLASCDEKALAATDMHVLAKDGIPMAFHRLWACRAAKAALTSMKAADYFGALAADYSVAHGDPDKYELTVLLGYTGDSRAIKLLGPMLLDRGCLDHSHPQRCHRASDTAALAMSRIIQPGFVKDPHMSYTSEWKQWWIENRAQYGDTSPIPGTSASTSSDTTHFTILRNTEINGDVTAASDSGAVTLNLDSIQIQLPLSPTKTENVNVVLAKSPQSNLLWWEFRVVASTESSISIAEFTNTHSLYMTQDAILGLWTQGNRIVVSEGRGHYQDLDTALTVIAALIQKNVANGVSTQILPTHNVDLWKVLGQSFFVVGSHVASASLTSISRKNSQWTIGLTGPNKDNAIVTLSGDFKVVGATLNGKVVYP